MPTIKQKKAASLIVENNGNVSKSMREAGYSKNFAKNPQTLLASPGFQEAAKPFIDQLEEEIQEAMREMKLKREKAAYNDLSGTVQGFKKLQQLLQGEATENVAVNIIEKFEVKD